MSSSEYNTRMLAKETNKMNYQIFQEQQKYNWDVMQAQNDYNSALQSRQRLEAAGFNPYMALDSGVGGTASSSLGVNPPTMQAPSSSGFDDTMTALDNLNSSLSTAANNVKTMSEANGLNIENQYKGDKMVAETNNFIADTEKKLSETKNTDSKTHYQNLLNKYQKFVNEHQNESWFNQQNLTVAQANLFYAQANQSVAETAYTQELTNAQITNNKYLDERNLKELNLLGSQILMNNESAKLSRAQAQNQLAHAFLNSELGKKANIDYQTSYAVAGYVVSSYESDATIKELRANNMFDYGSEEAPTTFNGSLSGSYEGTAGADFGVVKAGHKFNGSISGSYSGYKKRH